MLDDEGRGYLMELMITKLLLLQQDIQIIGMSATLSVCLLLRTDCRRWMMLTKTAEYGTPGAVATRELLHLQVPAHPHRRVPGVRECHLPSGQCERVLPDGSPAEHDRLSRCCRTLQDDRQIGV